jgi:GGDEF domain-containing protein
MSELPHTPAQRRETAEAPAPIVFLEPTLSTEIRENPGNFALVVIDLERFKEINDTYGHLEGNRYLRFVRDVLQESVRSEDPPLIPAQRRPDNRPSYRPRDTLMHNGASDRLHGDEFWVVLRGVESEDDVRAYITRTQTELYDFGVGVSMGGVMHVPGMTATDLYYKPDQRQKYNREQRRRHRYDALSPAAQALVQQISTLAILSGLPPREIASLIELFNDRGSAVFTEPTA